MAAAKRARTRSGAKQSAATKKTARKKAPAKKSVAKKTVRKKAKRKSRLPPIDVRAQIRVLKRLYPAAKCSLDYKTPFQLLVATILSAQCTDERVNMTTPDLFARYPGPAEFAEENSAEIEEAIRSTGFFRSKAKSIQAASRDIVEKHGGKIPATLEELVELHGVGRKTANVVLGNAFEIPGIVVDTHVTRLSNRMGLTAESDAVKIEFELMEKVPKSDWTLYSHLLIYHGRAVCQARKPRCGECKLAELCPKIGVDKSITKEAPGFVPAVAREMISS